MTATQAFERSLDELGVSVSHADPETFREAVEAAVRAPAVGVALDEAFDDPAVSLAETSVAVDPTPAALRAATTGVTGARFAVADYGTLVLPATGRGSELVSLFVDRHVAVVRASDVLPDMEAAVDAIDEEFDRTHGSAVLATGPSATADMGALVTGAHGPKTVHVVVLDDAAEGA